MRQLSTGLILIAIFITLVVFVSGIAIGKAMDREFMDDLKQQVADLSERTNSNIAILLLDTSPDYCPFLEEEMGSLEQDVETLGYKLNYMEDTKGAVDIATKSQYFNLQLTSYLLSERAKKTCDENFTTILYFYSNQNCGEPCREQGKSLLSLKEDKNIWVKIYSFDPQIGSASANILAKRCNITTYPSVVIEGKKFEGLQSVGQLKNALKQG